VQPTEHRLAPAPKGKPGAEIPPNDPVAEGLYLGVVRGTWKDLRDAKLVRVKVTEVLADGVIVGEVGRGLEGKISIGKLIFLIRPPQSTSEQIQGLPDMVTLEEGPAPRARPSAAAVKAKAEPTESSRADRSAQNLAAIAKALHGYKGTRACFPPAVLNGPDGRPWHSWRVLILPFFDDRSLRAIYDRYKFDEPWDGPHNKQLLDPMPTVYTDHPAGAPADTFTRYAAVTGPGTMFAAEGVAFDPTIKPRRIGHGMREHDLRDDAFTLVIGTLSGDAEVPWMKPEDVVVVAARGSPCKARLPGAWPSFTRGRAASSDMHRILDSLGREAAKHVGAVIFKNELNGGLEAFLCRFDGRALARARQESPGTRPNSRPLVPLR